MPVKKIRYQGLLITAFFFLFSLKSVSQDTLPYPDSIHTLTLRDVRVVAFEHNRSLKDLPAAVNYISQQQMNRYGPASIVPAVNATPGIRMEERSPGSYRINIRGSSLRSPFGVRNVKIYLNDLPYTDPGGSSFLNQLGQYQFNSIEIIKGPGSSLYGSGTGGVMLIQSLPYFTPTGLTAEYTAGSYNSHNRYIAFDNGNAQSMNRVSFQNQSSDGYRLQSAMEKTVFSWNGRFRLNERQTIKANFLYGDHFYETPGALTAAEYTSNPKGARPGGGGFPGAIAARASIRQKTFLAGVTLEQGITKWLKNKSGTYGMFTQLVNPNLRAFEKSSLPHFGGRTSFQFSRSIESSNLQIDIGGEWQKGYQLVQVHKNLNGYADSLRSSDEIDNRAAIFFAQGSLDLASGWYFLAGISANWLKVDFARYNPALQGRQSREFRKVLAPRFSLMKRWDKISLYTGISRGFSPPTTGELLPTGGAINNSLDAEKGVNIELGMKAAIDNRLTIDLNLFQFRLSQTIVQRRDAGGGDYFINAGKTKQEGLELAMYYPLFVTAPGQVQNSQVSLNYTYHYFRYSEFVQVNNEYSGNALPGVAPHTIAAGVDLELLKGFNFSINYFFSDQLPLNDANSVYADSYHLLGCRIEYKLPFGEKLSFRLAGGADNLLNEKYSLGNDLNGFGGRYFNAAPARNFYGGIRVQWQKKIPAVRGLK